MENSLTDTVERIHRLFTAFTEDTDKHLNGNKSAGQRARVQSLELEKALKEFRKVSIQNK